MRRKYRLFIAIGLATLLVSSVVSCAPATERGPSIEPPPPIVVEPPPPVAVEPPPPVVVEEVAIPAHYTTYTDEKELFSISYPSDWELLTWVMKEVEQYAKEELEEEAKEMGIPEEELESYRFVFMAGRELEDMTYDPFAQLMVAPLLGEWEDATLDEVYEGEMIGIEYLYPDLRVFSETKTTINGREAILADSEYYEPELGAKVRCLDMVMIVGITEWYVICSTYSEDFSKWEQDFDYIIRSFKVLE